MVEPNNSLYCYHFNATGHTVALTNINKTIVNKYAYSPFGTIANQEETVVQPFKFVGQYGIMTEDNGWYYMRARYYDPAVGRFISEDPIGFDGEDANLYAYVGNNPVMLIDQNGEFWHSLVAGGISGTISGGLTFVTELSMGKSLKNAAKSALVTGATTAVSVTLATSGVGASVATPAAMLTNAAMQKLVNGNVNVTNVAFTALPPSFGGAILNKVGTNGVPKIAQGVATALIAAPANVGSSALLPSK